MDNLELRSFIKRTFFEILDRTDLDEEVELFIEPELKGKWGRASLNKGRLMVEINFSLHQRHPEEVPETLAHEVAHLVCFRRFPRERVGHGSQWQTIAVELGASPSRWKASNPDAKPCWLK